MVSSEVHPDLFEGEAEANLWAAYRAAIDRLGTDQSQRLSTLVDASTDLATAIDSFFDDALVMVENKDVRANRLALLARVRDLGTGLVDWDAVPEI